jgi:hypothetical protein
MQDAEYDRKYTKVVRTKEELKADGYSPDFNPREYCTCGAKMWGKAQTYQPAYDNTFELEECPECGNSWSASL